MRDVLEQIRAWQADGKDVALATVVSVWGSAPRPPGSKMAVSSDGEMVGSVSGGCVEGAVAEEARGVLAAGEPKLLSYGVSDETAWSVGLSCGGTIEVFVEPFAEPPEAVERGELVTVATVVGGPGIGRRLTLRPSGDSSGGLGSEELDARARELAKETWASFAARRGQVEIDGAEYDVFLDVHPPAPKLVIVGAVHVAIHLIHFAKRMGFETLVIDPRTAFATPERFAHADRLLPVWPQQAFEEVALDEATYVAVLSHDLKIDVPALVAALDSPARYVAALGSRKTHAKRVAALREAGVGDEAIEAIRSPIGLDLGGRKAEEIALSVMAEIVAVSHGRG